MLQKYTQPYAPSGSNEEEKKNVTEISVCMYQVFHETVTCIKASMKHAISSV
jgi:hypothetical protein